MSVAEDMKTRLEAAFRPERLEIRNDSAKHRGHGGDDGSGESHFHIVIRAESLSSLPRVARHRAVHAALGDLNTRVHAIGLDLG